MWCPAGPWLYWLQATTAAGFALLAFLQLQASSAAKGRAAAARNGGQAKRGAADSNGVPRARVSKTNGDSVQMQASANCCSQPLSPARPLTPAAAAAARQRSLRHFITALCLVMAAAVLLPQQQQLLLAWPAWRQLGLARTRGPLLQVLASTRELAIVAATPALFHWAMRTAAGCFSVGEGALLSQALSLILWSAPSKLRLLPVFVPGWAAVQTREEAQLQPALLVAFVMLLAASMLSVCWLVWAGLSLRARAARRQGSTGRSPKRRSLASGPAGVMRPLQLAVGGAALAMPAAVVVLLAAWTLLSFLPGAAHRRAGVLAYWTGVLLVGLAAMQAAARGMAVPQVRWFEEEAAGFA